MKTCTKCGETKPFTEFYKHKRNKDGYAYCCKSCVAVLGRLHREENREAVLERKRRYNQENKEAIKERKRRYREENKEAIKERKRRYREDNKEAIAEYNRRYREERIAEQPACVYQIVNSINGKVYVGETTRGDLRWNQHLRCLRGNRHVNSKLQADFNEFGEDVFEWSTIQELPKDKEVLEREETNTIERLLAEGKELYNVQKN